MGKNNKVKSKGEWSPEDLTLSQLQRTARMIGAELEVEIIPENDICSTCGRRIRVQIFRNSGVCSDNCRKARDGNDPEIARH